MTVASRTRLGLGMVALGIAAGLIGGIAWAAIPGAEGVVQGCYDRGGNVKVVSEPPCPKGFTPFEFLGTTGKAADSDLLDGRDSTQFVGGNARTSRSLVEGSQSFARLTQAGDLQVTCTAAGYSVGFTKGNASDAVNVSWEIANGAGTSVSKTTMTTFSINIIPLAATGTMHVTVHARAGSGASATFELWMHHAGDQCEASITTMEWPT
jgi:hypothetical protein